MSLAEWAERTYSDASRPSQHTLRRMATSGEVPGAVQSRSGRWWVDVDNLPEDTTEVLRRMADNDPVLLRAMGL